MGAQELFIWILAVLTSDDACMLRSTGALAVSKGLPTIEALAAHPAVALASMAMDSNDAQDKNAASCLVTILDCSGMGSDDACMFRSAGALAVSMGLPIMEALAVSSL